MVLYVVLLVAYYLLFNSAWALMPVVNITFTAWVRFRSMPWAEIRRCASKAKAFETVSRTAVLSFSILIMPLIAFVIL